MTTFTRPAPGTEPPPGPFNDAPLVRHRRGWYYGWRRAGVHAAFWLLVFGYEAVQAHFSPGPIAPAFIVYTLRKVFTMAVIHYAFAYGVIPRLLLAGKWLPFLLGVLAGGVLLSFNLYHSLAALPHPGVVPGYGQPLADFYLRYGFAAALTDPVRLFQVIIAHEALFFTLLIKNTRSFFASSVEKLRLEKENMRLEKEVVNLEMNLLKLQINPHFFFNTLNNIYSLIEDKDEVAAGIVLQLSDLMRYTLYESHHNAIPLRQELNFIRNYVELEKIRYQHHVSVKLDVGDHPRDLAIPPLILITFVENAFKHGVKNNISPSCVEVSIRVEDNALHFRAQNSKPEKLSGEHTSGGIGLLNVRRRLELLYPDRHELRISNQSATYTVHLTLQLDEKSVELPAGGRRTPGAGTDREVHQPGAVPAFSG